MTEEIETQRSLDPNTNPIMAPPHKVLDNDPTRPHPLSVNEDGERISMDEEPKRAPDRDQGVSIPEEGAGDPGASDADAPASDGPSEDGGMSQGGGSTGEGGGASQGGGTGN